MTNDILDLRRRLARRRSISRAFGRIWRSARYTYVLLVGFGLGALWLEGVPETLAGCLP